MSWIHRAGVQADFARIPNATLRDRRLSYAARGVLAEILSHPDDWRTSAAAMSVQAAKVGEGRYGMAAIFRELKAAGYIRYEVTRGHGGRFATHVHIYEVPPRAVDSVSAGRTGNRSTAGRSAETPPPASPPPGGPPPVTSAGRRSSPRRSTKTEDKDLGNEDVITPDEDLAKIAAEELAAAGRTVAPGTAAEVVRLVLGGRRVKRKGAYLRAAIRADPARYVPKSSGPPRYSGGKFIE